MLNEFVYCPRLFYLEWVEGLWDDNADTAAGGLAHARSDRGGGRMPSPDEEDWSGEALAADLRAECRRRGLPAPRVSVGEPRGVAGIGLSGGAQLTFEAVVSGSIVLGQSRYLGGGLFVGASPV